MSFNEKNAVAVVARMLKNVPAERESLKYTWIDAEGRQVALDGFLGFRFNTPLAGLPDMPYWLTPINEKRLFPATLAGYMKIETPNACDVDALIKDDNAHKIRTRKGVTEYAENADMKRGLYTWGQGLPAVNLHYLRDALKVFPDAEFYIVKEKGAVSVLYIKSQYGDGLLCPVRFFGTDPAPRRIPTQAATKTAAPAFSLASFAARYAA